MMRVVPALLVGAVAVGAAELSLSLLLYARPGFMRALTVLLAVQFASLAVGLAVAPRRDPDGRWTVRAALDLRRRWLLSVAALGVSAVAAGGWSLLGGLGGTGVQRGVAAAALASLPQLTLGGVLGGMASRSPRARIGAWAALGGAIGAVALGGGLGTRLLPTSLLLAGTVLVSAAALLDGRVDRETLAVVEPAASPPEEDAMSIVALAPEDVVPVGALAPDDGIPVEFLAPDPVPRGRSHA